MGALHDGHLSLVKEAKKRTDFVVVSIFVNPTQFGPNEDFAKYPRDLESDRAKVAAVGAAAVFAPTPDLMYSASDATRVRVAPLEPFLCGPIRPGHFEGVATVVTKLLNLVGPSVAVFGQKDFQQLAILRALARDLFLPVEIVGYPIVRESDGLAMSSRNAYLTTDQRARATALSQGLFSARAAYESGERKLEILEGLVRNPIAAAADSIDYVSLADPTTLIPKASGEVAGPLLVAVAARFGETRLLDNIVLGE
jgi:pantoate--beta-alanine ligase